jgi:hypothetical protein
MANGGARFLRLGTRGSQLARWQAEWVAGELRRLGLEVELVEIATRGDVEGGRPIEEIGTRGVFTKEIQRALLAGDVDLGVHSLKDLPTEAVEGLVIAAVPARESAADVLVLRSEERGSRSEMGKAGCTLQRIRLTGFGQGEVVMPKRGLDGIAASLCNAFSVKNFMGADSQGRPPFDKLTVANPGLRYLTALR